MMKLLAMNEIVSATYQPRFVVSVGQEALGMFSVRVITFAFVGSPVRNEMCPEKQQRCFVFSLM
jgi:hypothetical protein